MHQNCEDERAEQIIAMTKNTCLLALDKTMFNVMHCKSYAISANKLLSVCDAINRAVIQTKRMA